MTSDDEVFLLFMNLHVVLRNSTPAEFAYIWQSKYIDIIPMKILNLNSLLNDVFTAVFILSS